MRESFRQSMAWLHTWSGLIVGWVLFFIFVTGTVGYFSSEIDRWMRPEQALPGANLSTQTAADIADAYLRRDAPKATSWSIDLPGRRNTSVLQVRWQPDSGGQQVVREYDASTRRFREPVPARSTGGGEALWRLHWQLHYMPRHTGVVIVGVCTMIMLVTLLTGIVAHKKIFRDFFTFRPRRGQRSWLDLHNIVGVTALPFFVMITFSGLVFFPNAYMPAAAHALYGDDVRQLEADSSIWLKPQARAGVPAPMLPLRELVSEARRYWPDGTVGRIAVFNPGDINARVRFDHEGGITLQRGVLQVIYFNAVSGKLSHRYDPLQSAPRALASALYGLHEGKFAGWTLRWLYFGSGLLGCGMIATGLVLWTVKRRVRHANTDTSDFGFRLVECLNIGTIAGLPIGIAAYFWANRLLPVSMVERAAWEMHTLFITWGLMLLWASLRSPGKAWVEELSIAAAAFGMLPLLNALTTYRHLGVTILAGDGVLAGFDLTALAIGLLFGLIAMRAHHRWHAPVGVDRSPSSVMEARL